MSAVITVKQDVIYVPLYLKDLLFVEATSSYMKRINRVSIVKFVTTLHLVFYDSLLWSHPPKFQKITKPTIITNL